MKNKVLQGDCLEVLKTLSDNSVDSIVTDPPYELGFMGKSWDNTGIAYNKEMWAECLRVLKPGGHLLAFSGTRTYHRMAVAIEDAGFEVRDMIEWVYGSGFPKSRNIGLDVDKRNGVTKNRGKAFVVAGQSGQRDKDTGGDLVTGSNTMGAYVAQNEWSGWGTALKPAHEPICMARKPLAEKTVAENVLKYGTGGINIDESRVAIPEDDKANYDFNNNGLSRMSRPEGEKLGQFDGGWKIDKTKRENSQGRFPANLILEDCEEVRECFPETKSSGGLTKNVPDSASVYGKYGVVETMKPTDSGNASRFFKSIIYNPKASKKDRGAGNNHATVKPVALMEYLINMVTTKDGIVLDPFAGSGTTAIAALKTNRNYILIEQEQEYIGIINKRIAEHQLLK